MNRRTICIVGACTIIAAVTWPGSCAWADENSALYFGGNFGRARNGYDTNMLDVQYSQEAASAGDTLSLSSRSWQRLSDVWWLNTGYLFTPYVGLDVAFLHAGQIKYLSAGSLLVGSKNESFGTVEEASSHGPALSIIGRLPLTERWEANLRVGDYFGKATFRSALSLNANNSIVVASKSTSALLVGAGTAYALGQHWSVRLDFLHINKTGNTDTGKFNIDMATAGISFTF